jgi:uncharacterized protein (DUF2267 family)
MTAITRPQNTTTSPTTPRDPANTPGTRQRPTWDELVEAIRDTGQYATTAEAARVTRVVLPALGGHVTGETRAELARSLPEEAARLVTSRAPVAHALVAAEFVDDIATRIKAPTPARARWDVSSVLSTLPRMVGAPLIDRVLAQLPQGYALLFGLPELTHTS